LRQVHYLPQCIYYRIGNMVFYRDRAHDQGFSIKDPEVGVLKFHHVRCVNEWAAREGITIPSKYEGPSWRIENRPGAWDEYVEKNPALWEGEKVRYLEEQYLVYKEGKYQ